MENHIYVYIDLQEVTTLVGQLWMRARGGRETASFEYDPSWLAHPQKFALDPALSLGGGAYHTNTGQAIFGAIGDSAPDRWGRVLMQRAEARRAQQAQTAQRTLMESDFLLMVNDISRPGALRFTTELGGSFLATSDMVRIPPLIELPRLLSASTSFINESEGDEDLRILLAPGSSLGGARPKASVVDSDQSLAIAKFPRPDDNFNVARWEGLALRLAERVGIPVPRWRIETISGKDVLILKRFDREGDIRIPFLSAMSMLGARDNEAHSYLEIMDALRQYGANPVEDGAQLWRRVVFNILISNTDDHLRNHAFLYSTAGGWKLSPAYDLNPVPVEIRPRVLSLAVDEHNTSASLEVAFSVAGQFGLSLQQAKDITREVAGVTSDWRNQAQAMGISGAEIIRMASAFEHADVCLAMQ